MIMIDSFLLQDNRNKQSCHSDTFSLITIWLGKNRQNYRATQAEFSEFAESTDALNSRAEFTEFTESTIVLNSRGQ
jgi:hypothetical protein